MKVCQVRLKLFMMKDVQKNCIQEEIRKFIDASFLKKENLKELHHKNEYKLYSYDYPFPLDLESGVYKKDNVYTLTVRTVSAELAGFFSEVLSNFSYGVLKGLRSEVKILAQRPIACIYTLTPAIMKADGYWKTEKDFDFEMYEKRIKENLIKKYNFINNTKIDENFILYNNIVLKNKYPIATGYKKIKLLGDKLHLDIDGNETAQNLAYMALGTGICELNSAGFGMCGFRYV